MAKKKKTKKKSVKKTPKAKPLSVKEQMEIVETEAQQELENGLNQMVATEVTPHPIAEAQRAKEAEPLQDSQTTSTPASTPKSTSKPSKVSPFRPNPAVPGQPATPSMSLSERVSLGQVRLDKFLDEHEVVHRDDPHLVRFQEFLDTEWGLPAVQVLFRGLFRGGFPPIPAPHMWKIPHQQLDIEELTWQQVQSPAFVEELFPSVKMLLDDNITNTQWAAQIMTVLAFFRVIQILPIVLKGYEE